MKLNPLFHSLMDCLLYPRFWCLRAWAVYSTGIILFLAAFTTLFTTSSQLHQSTEEIIESFHLLVIKYLESFQNAHLIINAYLANMEEFKLVFSSDINL